VDRPSGSGCRLVWFIGVTDEAQNMGAVQQAHGGPSQQGITEEMVQLVGVAV
jgi:hypothetical protein